MNWFSIENYDPAVSNRTISGIMGLGVSYYFKPTSPSLYINAGIGVSVWYRLLSETTWRRFPGPGAMGGIGYEFTRHWSVECGVMWCNNMMALFFSGSNVDSLAISLSIIGIAY